MGLQFRTEPERKDFEELMRLIKRGDCILFLGAGVSKELGLPSGMELALELARECDYPKSKPLVLSHVAQHYQTRFNRQRLIDRVRKLVERRTITLRPSSYDLIVEIDQLNHPIITTNWDDQPEQAFNRKNKAVRTVRYKEQVADMEQPHAIIKPHGDFECRPEEIVLTRDDVNRTYEKIKQPGGLFAQVGARLATKTILFVGYSLDDEDFLLLYQLVQDAIGTGMKTHYAVMPHPSRMLEDEWRQKGVRILDAMAHELFEEVFTRTRRFVNREDELEYICTRATMPYVEILGFAGSGKSSLLNEVWGRYELTGYWVQACVIFEQLGEERESSWCTHLAGQSSLELADEIARQTKGQGLDLEGLKRNAQGELAQKKGLENLDEISDIEVEERAGTHAATELAKRLVHDYTLLLFDSSERIPEPILRWIEGELIPSLEEYVIDHKEQLRLVFAGRSPLPWRSPLVKKNLHVRPLTPFSEGAVGAMLDSFAALKLRDPLPKAKRAAIVKGMLDITSGHPKCIHNILTEIKDREFDVSSDDFEREKKRLFEEHVSSVVGKEILGKIEEDIRDIFCTVCVFRSLSADILDVLRQEGYVNEQFTDALTLLGQLRSTYLLGQPDPPPMYPIDRVVRRILAMSMELKSPNRYHKLNELALRTFEELLAQAPMSALSVVYLNEALFHQVQLWRFESQSSDEVKEQLRNTLEGHLERLQLEEPHLRLSLLENLQHRLESDKELLDSVADLVPGDEYQTLISPVERAIG